MAHEMITFEHQGNLNHMVNVLKRMRGIPLHILEKYGDEGLAALREATPKDTGLTANAWYYQIVEGSDGTTSLRFLNANVVDGWCNVAVILQYGHATGTGGWVEGFDYINPALKPIFERMVDNIWKEVKNTR